MIDLLSRAATSFAEEVFLQDTEGSFTFSRVEESVARLAAATGDRTGEQLVVRPGIDSGSVIELLAVLRAGATAVVVPPRLPKEQARRLIEMASTDHRPTHSILFTSGSAGGAKGVRFSAENWEAAATASIAALGHSRDDRWLCPLPLHHVGGLSIIFRSLAAGGTVVLAENLSRASTWLDRVGYASVVPTQLRRILMERTDVFTGAPRVLIGGGPVDPALVDKASASGLIALPTYGMTETTSQIATARPDDPSRRLFPLPGTEIRIGHKEMIEVRGPTVALGYLRRPELVAGEWFVTSDRGEMQPDGSLVVLGRSDRVIITGGENVDPAEVEATLATRPDIDDAAVFGLPDEEWGQVVAAAYVGNVEPTDLVTYLSAHHHPAAIPRRWLRLDHLPRNDLGKIDLDDLIAWFDAPPTTHHA